MPRPPGTRATEARVRQLSSLLFAGVAEGTTTVAEIAREAGLRHETVRKLYASPTDSYRYGPGFFIVVSIARAQGLSLDTIVRRLHRGGST